MFLEEGTRVRFIHTGDEGVITELLNKDMVRVMLEDGDEIPASVEDIRLATAKAAPASIIKAKEEAREKAFNPTIITGRKPVTNQGLFVGFETKYDWEGNPNKYIIYLINDTKYDVVFNYERTSHGGNNNAELNGLSKTNTAFPLGELQLDEFNDSPLLSFQLWVATTMGNGAQMDKSLRVKAKQFFSKLKTAPVLNSELHLYELARKLNVTEEEEKQETLSSYTHKIAEERRKEHLVEDYYYQSGVPNIKDKANFSDEIDLHIEMLTTKHKDMTNAEKLNVQIEAFEKYIDEAYAIGFERVFVIHGLGKGRLRDIISSRLIRNDKVKTFKNDYHPKYGFGATEVLLKED